MSETFAPRSSAMSVRKTTRVVASASLKVMLLPVSAAIRP